MFIVEGMIISQETRGKNKVRLTIADKSTAKKIARVFKYKPDEFKIPLNGDEFVITLNGKTKITTADGREDISVLPNFLGWRCRGKIKSRQYKFKSRFGENKGEQIYGATFVCAEISVGANIPCGKDN